MNCKFCNAELNDTDTVCPSCGKENVEQTEAVTVQMPVFSAEEIGEGMPFEQELQEENGSLGGKPKRKIWQIVLAVACCVVLLAALAVLVLQGMGIDLGPRENDIYYKDSYTVSDKTAVRKADDVVASVGDAVLTNSQLQVFYWLQVNEYLRYNGTSDFDYTKPLNEQVLSEETGITWQQYFIEAAIRVWQRYQLLNLVAEEEKPEIVDRYQITLDDVYEDMEKMAAQYDFESADAMIRADMGAACSVEDYVAYMGLNSVAMRFIEEKFETADPTMDELEAYYRENKDAFVKAGITKDSGYVVDVRHILVQLEDVPANANGKIDYTDDQWEACRQQAQKLLDDWKAGAADESAFAELANAHSKDGGSNTSGGLYTQVTKGYMVEAFDAWIFDENRAVGDTGLVKTEFGYHIMYFVGSEDEWVAAARNNLIYERSEEVYDRVEELVEEATAKWPMQIDYKKIALTEIEM